MLREEMEMVTQAMQSQAITPTEQAIGCFTQASFDPLVLGNNGALANTSSSSTFMTSRCMVNPSGSHLVGAVVLRPHWQCSIKRDDTRRSRNCCDGSP